MIKNGYLLGAASLLFVASCANLNPPAERVVAGDKAGKPAMAAMQPYSNAEFKSLLEQALRTISKDDAAKCSPVHGTCPVGIDVGPSCQLAITPDIYQVPRGVRILWQLAPGWTFKPNGIEFKNPGSAFAGHGNPSGRIYFWDVDANAPSGYYGYWIHITDGTHSCDVDPGIWI